MTFSDFKLITKAGLAMVSFGVLGSLGFASVSQSVSWTRTHTTSVIDHAGNVVTIDGVTIEKHSPNGNLVWSVTLSSNDGFDFSHRPIFDAANNLYVDGFSDNRTAVAAVTVVKISAAGAISWNRKFTVGGVNTSEHMSEGPLLIAPNGSLYLIGHTGMALATHYPTTLFRINASTGAIQNQRTVTDTIDVSRGMVDTVLAADSSSNIYYGHPGGLFSYNASLSTERWNEATMTTPVRAIAVDSWNNVYVTGGIQLDPEFSAFYVKRINGATGTTVWTTTMAPAFFGEAYPGVTFSDNRNFGGNAIAIDSKGFIWAAGHGFNDFADWNGGVVNRYDPAHGTMVMNHPYGNNFSGSSVFALALDDKDFAYAGGRVSAFNGSDTVVGQADIISADDGTVFSELLSVAGGMANEVTQIAADKSGRVVVSNVSYDNVTTIHYIAGLVTTGRVPNAIGTSGNGKTKVLMDTWNHQNIQLSTFSAADVLQANPTSYNYGTYGRHDVALSCGPDNNVRILQQLDFNGTTSAAVSVIIRNDAGAITTSSANNVTNLRAVKIATGSDNKSYILLRSTTDGSCQVWRMSATGVRETTATFGAQTDKIPAAVAVDGTSIVYLIWQGLDGRVYPWRLNTSLAVTNQTAVLDPGVINRLVDAGVGLDHRLRLLCAQTNGTGMLFAMNSSGGVVGSALQSISSTFSATNLSVGPDNRSHLLWNDFERIDYGYSLANSALALTNTLFFTLAPN